MAVASRPAMLAPMPTATEISASIPAAPSSRRPISLSCQNGRRDGVAKARPTPRLSAPKKPRAPQARIPTLTRVIPPRDSMMLCTMALIVPGSSGSAASRRPITMRRASPSPTRKLKTITPSTTTWKSERTAK